MARFLMNRITLIKLSPQSFILKRSRICERNPPRRTGFFVPYWVPMQRSEIGKPNKLTKELTSYSGLKFIKI